MFAVRRIARSSVSGQPSQWQAFSVACWGQDGADGDCRFSITNGDGDDGLLISVDDNGPGIPEASREEVFEVFKRLHRAGDVDGTGLGLSICRKILKQYHGKIWCEESPLDGAAMKVR